MPIFSQATHRTHEMNGIHFTTLAAPHRGARTTSVWQVEIPPGTPATPHEVTEEEIFVITSGDAIVCLGDDEQRASAGDCIVVPPDTWFELRVSGDRPLTALVCFPVGGRARLADGTEFTPPWAQ